MVETTQLKSCMHLISALFFWFIVHCNLRPEAGLRLWMEHASGVVLKGFICGYKHFGGIISVKLGQFVFIWVF